MKKYILLLIVGFSINLSSQNPDDQYWSDKFGVSGIVNGGLNLWGMTQVKCIERYKDKIILAGQFSINGNNITMWDLTNKKWVALGKGIGSDSIFSTNINSI